MVKPIQPYVYSLEENDTDWIHTAFVQCWTSHKPFQTDEGVNREHRLYGPQNARLSWIYPPSHGFMVKPQASLMSVVFPDDDDAADTSLTSTKVVDGDASFDSMGGRVASPWRDVFIQRDRREADFVVSKKLFRTQIPFLVVELKRDDMELEAAIDQIQLYMNRILERCKVSGLDFDLYGLLVLGRHSLRLVGRWDRDIMYVKYMDLDVAGKVHPVETDSVLVNEWLVGQAFDWSNI